jgi:hypothetical protein
VCMRSTEAHRSLRTHSRNKADLFRKATRVTE